MRVGINVSPLYSASSLRGIGYYTKNLLSYLKNETNIEVQEFDKLSEIKDTQLIHYPWFDFYFHTLPIIRKYPTVVTIHDVIPLVFPKQYPPGFKGEVNFFLQKLALSSCKFIITDSLVSKRDIIKYLRIEENKVVAIPLAVDSKYKILKDADLLKVKRKYNLPEQFLMYAGDANWNKNLPFLIEGFKQLIKIPEFNEAKLLLAGGVFLKNVEDIEHPELQSLKIFNKKIKEYQLENKVIRPGNVSDDELIAFYNLTTAYVQPSIYEGFGLPILQAFACGAPVVSSNSGSLSEVGGNAALYFNPANLNQFISILIELLQDRSLQHKLSKLGFEQAGKFSWERTIKKTVEVYNLAIKST